jgi:hypothetical protein
MKSVAFRIALLVSITVLSSGCATERLRDNTVSVASSTTDVFYYMVLENVARQHEEPGALPWGIQLSSGQVAVNDTQQLTGGYQETWPKVVPSATLMQNRALQQNWNVAPVNNQAALLEMRKYFYLASCHQPVSEPATPQLITTQTETTNGSDRPKTTIMSQTASADDIRLGSIDTRCFEFCTLGKAPANSYHVDYGATTAFVRKTDDHIQAFTKFTLLILDTINQGSATPSSTTAPGPGGTGGQTPQAIEPLL